MQTTRERIQAKIAEIEHEMKRIDYWQSEPRQEADWETVGRLTETARWKRRVPGARLPIYALASSKYSEA